MFINCKEVLVKFVDKGVPAQELRALQTTGAEYISVDATAHHIILYFKTSQDRVVKVVCFAQTGIKEYVCEGIVWDTSTTDTTPLQTGLRYTFK